MERSPIRDIEIKYILKQALTDKINDREVFMKGIDASYHYEGYTLFRTEDIAKAQNKTMTMDDWKKQISVAKGNPDQVKNNTQKAKNHNEQSR